jgi:hypothetical protein
MESGSPCEVQSFAKDAQFGRSPVMGKVLLRLALAYPAIAPLIELAVAIPLAMRDLFRYAIKLGTATADRIPIIATTIISSIRVNPLLVLPDITVIFTLLAVRRASNFYYN